MNSRQIAFFLLPEDYKDLEIYFKNRGDTLFLIYPMKTEKLITTDTLLGNYFGNMICLVNKNQIYNIKFEYIKKQNYYIVDRSISPLIELDTINNEKELKEIPRGRFYYQPKVFINGEWIDQNEEFIKWANEIYKRFKKSYRLGKDIIYEGHTLDWMYVSDRVREWVKKGGKLKINP